MLVRFIRVVHGEFKVLCTGRLHPKIREQVVLLSVHIQIETLVTETHHQGPSEKL